MRRVPKFSKLTKNKCAITHQDLLSCRPPSPLVCGQAAANLPIAEGVTALQEAQERVPVHLPNPLRGTMRTLRQRRLLQGTKRALPLADIGT